MSTQERERTRTGSFSTAFSQNSTAPTTQVSQNKLMFASALNQERKKRQVVMLNKG